MPVTTEASRILEERRDAIADRVTHLYFEARPQLEARWKGARQRCTEDNRHHIDYLCEALSFGRPNLFSDYAAWTATLLARLNIPGEALAFNFELLQTTLAAELEGADRALAVQYVAEAIAKIKVTPPDVPSCVEGGGALDALSREYLDTLLKGQRHAAGNLILAAIDAGTSIKDIYLFVFQRALREVGRLWQSNRIGVAQEHYCTACTQAIMSQLYPRIFSGERNGHRLVATCVGGDLHEIGVRMVTDFFEIEGWDTYYLGANTPITGTLQQVAERAPHVLAISATMPTHLKAVAELIAATREAGNPPWILVGGAPFNSHQDLWKDVGADGYACDAAAALSTVAGWIA